ncbi:MAG: type IV pilus biogenesis protein PilM [Acidobacteriota bacterium]
MSRSLNKNRPQVACEISADAVVAGRARLQGDGLETYTVRDLPEGTVSPDLTEANVLRGDALRDAVKAALDEVAGRARDVITILPDAAVRVALLDFETLPEKREEAEAVVRFRLKKSLPFDVDKARVSYQVQPGGSSKEMKVIAAVALAGVLDEYEAAFRDCGYAPGVVLPSMLAALGAVDAARPTLVVKVDPFTTSIAILEKQQLLLFRTLENARGLSITGEQLAEDVYPSVVFFQDTYKLDVERVFVAGLPNSEVALQSLHAQTGVEVQELAGTEPAPGSQLAGVTGALLS